MNQQTYWMISIRNILAMTLMMIIPL